jgi:hypothetical protein
LYFSGGHLPSGPACAEKLSDVWVFSASEIASITGLGSAIRRLSRAMAFLTALSVTLTVIIA